MKPKYTIKIKRKTLDTLGKIIGTLIFVISISYAWYVFFYELSVKYVR